MTTNSCPHCGKSVPPDAPGGLCPECMLDVGASPPTGPIEPDGTVLLNDPPPSLPLDDIAKLFPQLEILDCLGRGGMGAVYKARQPKLDRIVAVKVLVPQSDDEGQGPGFTERFEREARALAQLNHPNIVAVYDFGETNGYLYLVMEYVEGLNLRQMIHAERLKSDEALAIVPHICEALQYAHEKGIIHRDIKPENILVNRAGQVKIADFGIAKILRRQPGEDALTREHHIMGTPHYMAPEQVEQPLTVDHRADIYSLGVVFYEMLTGELPLGKFAPPSRKVNVDVRLDEVVLHALEKEPDRRYQRASEVKTDIEGISHHPNQARLTPPDHLNSRQKALLKYGFVGCLFGFPVGMLMSLPFVTMLSAIGLIVTGLKWTDRWPFPSLLADAPSTARPSSPPSGEELTEAQMMMLYVGFACCIGGLGVATIPGSPPLFRVFLSVLSLVGLSTIVPAIVLRRRLFMPTWKGSSPTATSARRGPLYWVITLLIAGFGLMVLFAIIAFTLSVALPAIQRNQAQSTEQAPTVTVLTGSDATADDPKRDSIHMNSEDNALRMTGPSQTKAPKVSPPTFTISAFGTEQNVTLDGEGDETERFFDLDTGRKHAAATSDPEPSATWQRDLGVDLVADTSVAGGALRGIDLIAIPVNTQEWDITAPRMAGLLLGASPRPTTILQANPDASPATYVFQTREGSTGVLQIAKVDTAADPPTISVRYKLSDGRSS